MSFGQMMAGAHSRRFSTGAKSELRLAFLMIGIWAAMAVLSLMPGMLVLTRHEGDAMHLAAMALRMADGQWPHLDYMTPIGVLAVAPIAGLVSMGLGLGAAIVWAQILLAAVLLPLAWWVAVSRFGTGWAALVYGALVIVMTMAFVHGGSTPALSISMHYNRWAWAIAFLVVPLVLLPNARGGAPRLEGAVLGGALAALALIKATYFVALLPAVLLSLVLRRSYVTFAWGLGVGVVVVLVVTALVGPAFWVAYVQDLLDVAGSGKRGGAGNSVVDVLVSPSHLAGTLVGLAAVVLLRKSGRDTEGLVMLALLPGLVLITWQNYGHDPQWLPVVALALFVLRPTGAGADRYVVAATVAFALSAAWMTNMAMSSVRMAGAATHDSGVFFPNAPGQADFRLAQRRLDKVSAEVPYAPMADAPDAPSWGAALPDCDLRSGGVRVFQETAAELEAAGFGNRQLLVADTFQSFWLFGSFPMLPGGTPWYYGGLPGGDSAEMLVVPLCPISDRARATLLDAADAAGWQLTEVFRGAHVAVLDIARTAN